MKKLKFILDVYQKAPFIVFLVLAIPVLGQTEYEGPSPQFLYPEFTIGKVIWRNGETQNIQLNYNTISEKMAYKKDDKIYDIVNPGLIDTVHVQGNKFVSYDNIFYELLLSAPLTFFVQYKGELIPPGTPAAYGGTSQVSNTKLMTSVGLSSGTYNLTLPTDYKVKVDLIYWVKIENKMFSFINQKQFLKLFPENESELKLFIKQNRLKFDNKTLMKKLAIKINDIV